MPKKNSKKTTDMDVPKRISVWIDPRVRPHYGELKKALGADSGKEARCLNRILLDGLPGFIEKLKRGEVIV